LPPARRMASRIRSSSYSSKVAFRKKAAPATPGRRAALVEMNVIPVQDRSCGERYRTFNDVLQLTNIARPVVLHKQFQGQGRDLLDHLATGILLGEASQEMVH